MGNNLEPRQVVDKNGKLTTVYVSPSANIPNGSRIGNLKDAPQPSSKKATLPYPDNRGDGEMSEYEVAYRITASPEGNIAMEDATGEVIGQSELKSIMPYDVSKMMTRAMTGQEYQHRGGKKTEKHRNGEVLYRITQDGMGESYIEDREGNTLATVTEAELKEYAQDEELSFNNDYEEIYRSVISHEMNMLLEKE